MIWETSSIKLQTLVSLNPDVYEFKTVEFYNAAEATRIHNEKYRLRLQARQRAYAKKWGKHYRQGDADHDYDHEYAGGRAEDFFGD
jgi:hypothetical protein